MATRKADNFVVFYKDNFDQYKTLNPVGLYCLSDSTVDLILSALRYSYWPTRWRLNENDRTNRVTGENWLDVQYWGELATQEVIKDMGCDLEQGFTLMADAIRDASNSDAIFELAKAVKAVANKPCCEDNTEVIVNLNGGINGSLSDGSITYGTVPSVDAPTTPPDGYENQAHYDVQRCARAGAMVDGAIIGFGVWLGIESLGAVGTTVALSLGFMGIITIPEVMIPSLIAALAIGYLAAGSIYAVRLELIAHRQDLICILYNGEGTSSITEALGELFDIIIAAAAVTGPVAVAFKTILLILFSADTINKLYDAFAGTDYAESDCGSCQPCDRDYQFSEDPFDAVAVSSKIVVANGKATTEGLPAAASEWFGGTWDVGTIVSALSDINLVPGVYGYGMTAKTVPDWQWGQVTLWEWDEESIPLLVANIYPLTTSFDEYTGTFTVTTGTKLLLGMTRGEPSSQYFVELDSLQIQGDEC